jgi:hypothetical protein
MTLRACFRPLALYTLVALAGACNGQENVSFDGGGADAAGDGPGGGMTISAPDGAPPSEGGATDGGGVAAPRALALLPFALTARVDLLFAIDNSASMGSKHEILQASVPSFIQRLTHPLCVDAAGQPIAGQSADDAGHCAMGTPEFTPVFDLHVGIVSSSLGAAGAQHTCTATATNPTNTLLNAHDDDQGHLLARGGADEHRVADLTTSNFLAWHPELSPSTSEAVLVADFQDLVSGVHEYGCGIESQLESWYRFLVQPDPYASISVTTGGRRALTGVDATVLTQRHDFLRPDSVVAVVMLTDEDDSAMDPMWSDGLGYAYVESTTSGLTGFPGSTGGGAPRGTSSCATTPNDPKCTSCALQDDAGRPVADPNDPACKAMGDPNQTAQCATGCLGYYPSADDNLNVRTARMKERYGIDPQFAMYRYVDGLHARYVPDRAHETHTGPNGEYDAPRAAGTGAASLCTNPLFAASLPTASNGELCNLPLGTRSPSMIFLLTIAGVPWQLLADTTAPGMPYKSALSADDWVKIIGHSPTTYDYSGQDPHMVVARAPNGSTRWDGPSDDTGRASLPPPSASDTADPISGREWDTKGVDLQSACVFDLPAPRDCSLLENKFACECTGTSPTAPDYKDPPLCDPTVHTMQLRARAVPAPRILTVANGLGAQAVVASVCARTSDEASSDFGYRPALGTLLDRVASRAASAACAAASDTCALVARLPAGSACSGTAGLNAATTVDDKRFTGGAADVCVVDSVACGATTPGYCFAPGSGDCAKKATPTAALTLPAGAALYLACIQ